MGGYDFDLRRYGEKKICDIFPENQGGATRGTMKHTLATLAFAIGASIAPLSGLAEEIAVRQIEYSNDSISDGGKTAFCEMTLVVTSRPDPRVLNFQFLASKSVVG